MAEGYATKGKERDGETSLERRDEERRNRTRDETTKRDDEKAGRWVKKYTSHLTLQVTGKQREETEIEERETGR